MNKGNINNFLLNKKLRKLFSFEILSETETSNKKIRRNQNISEDSRPSTPKQFF